MIFLPYLGLLITLSLWGTYIRVPGFIDPAESFIKRLTGAMHATTLAKGVHQLVSMSVSAAASQNPHHHHQSQYMEPFAHFADLTLTTTQPLDRVDDNFFLLFTNSDTIVSTTSVSTAPDFGLWDVDDVEDGIDIEHPSFLPSAPLSPASLIFGIGIGITLLSLTVAGLVCRSAFTSGGAVQMESSCRCNSCRMNRTRRSGAIHFRIIGSGLSLYEEMDLLRDGKMSWADGLRFGGECSGGEIVSGSPCSLLCSKDVGPTTLPTVYILREVSAAIARLERRRLIVRVCAVELSDDVSSAFYLSTPTSTSPADVVDSPVEGYPPRQWALVRRRPENMAPVVVFFFVRALAASWERYTAELASALLANDPGTEPEQNQGSSHDGPGDVSVAEPTGYGKRKRPGKTKRLRQKKAEEREKELEASGRSAPTPRSEAESSSFAVPAAAALAAYHQNPAEQQPQQQQQQYYYYSHGYAPPPPAVYATYRPPPGWGYGPYGPPDPYYGYY